MRINQLKAGSILSYVQMVISILISLVYTPIVLKILGQSEYGLYQTVSSSVSMLSMLNLGLNVSYVHFYTKYKENHDSDGMARYNGLFLTILLVLGSICFIVGMIMINNIELVFADGLTSEEYTTARILMFLLIISTTLSFPISTFTGMISACEKFVYLRVQQIAKTIVIHGLSLVALYAGGRSVGMVCTTVAVTVVIDIIHLIYAFGKLRCRIKFGNFEKGLFKAMIVYTSFIALNVIVDQINLNIDKMLLARYKGTSEVAVYNIGFMIYTYYQTFSTSISGVLAPRVHRIIYNTKDNQEEQRKKVTELFIKTGRIQCLLIGLIGTGFLVFGKAFITEYWASAEYERSYYVALILVAAASIPLIQNVGITILQAMNKHRFRSYLYAGIAVFNLLLSIQLCQIYGAIGSTIGTALALLIGNVVIINIYYYKKANIDVLKFWKSILRLSVGFVIPVAFGLVYASLVDLARPMYFIMGILGYCVIYGISIWLFSMNKEEKKMISEPLQKLRKRRLQ